MRKTVLFPALALLLAAGCGPKTPPAASSAGSTSASVSAEEPLVLEELTVELPREVEVKAARAAMKELPEKLADHGVTVKAVSLTYGASPAAMAEAVSGGGVMLAILPAEDLARYGGGASVILADARQEGGPAGTYAEICAAPTEYGAKLADLAEKRQLTWAELDHARWGVLAADSLAGNRCLELWLTDHYADDGLADLASVTVYAGWEELLRAAAEGEIDLFPLLPELRETYGPVWTLESSRTDENGLRGFGRQAELDREITAIGETERLCAFAAAVTPENEAVNDERFTDALCQALNDLCDGPAERKAALGAEWFAPAEDGDLDGLRRLHFGE